MTNKKENFFFVILFGLLSISMALNLIQSNKIDELVHETIKLHHEQKALESYMNEFHNAGGAEYGAE